MSDRKLTVLFVGGYGRSGSTILDLLLDRVPGITAVGEFRHLFGRALGDNELCSCGRPFSDCPFWQKVIARAFPDGFDRQAINQAVKTFNTVVRAPQLLKAGKLNSQLESQARIYREAYSAAYRAVADMSGASVIVDSSKYPMHGLFLRTLPDIELKTMQLVRDPRAVAYSWQRRRIRPEVHWEKREMPRHDVVRSAMAWNVSNSLTEKISDDPEHFRLQRYEDFIDKPLETIEAMASFALGKNIKLYQKIFSDQPRTPHTIAGNPVRLGKEHIKVRADAEWQEQMNSLKKLLVTVLCSPQMKKFGYELKS